MLGWSSPRNLIPRHKSVLSLSLSPRERREEVVVIQKLSFRILFHHLKITIHTYIHPERKEGSHSNISPTHQRSFGCLEFYLVVNS